MFYRCVTVASLLNFKANVRQRKICKIEISKTQVLRFYEFVFQDFGMGCVWAGGGGGGGL